MWLYLRDKLRKVTGRLTKLPHWKFWYFVLGLIAFYSAVYNSCVPWVVKIQDKLLYLILLMILISMIVLFRTLIKKPGAYFFKTDTIVLFFISVFAFSYLVWDTYYALPSGGEEAYTQCYKLLSFSGLSISLDILLSFIAVWLMVLGSVFATVWIIKLIIWLLIRNRFSTRFWSYMSRTRIWLYTHSVFRKFSIKVENLLRKVTAFFSSWRHMWRRLHKVHKGYMISIALLSILMIASMAFAYNMYSRLSLVEQKLGGRQVISCDQKELIKQVQESTVRLVGGSGDGTGFAISEHEILTNFHVIQEEASPKVVFIDQTFETGEVIRADATIDLAVVWVNKTLKPLSLPYKTDINVGDKIISIGFPHGIYLPGDSSIKTGTVSSILRDSNKSAQYIQTDMELIEGMSGGPMITECGQVVGVNVAAMTGLGLGIHTNFVNAALSVIGGTDSADMQKIKKIEFDPDSGPVGAVQAYYDYIKTRQLDKAYDMLSPNFIGSVSYDAWVAGYSNVLDVSVWLIAPFKGRPNIVYVHFGSQDLVDNKFVLKEFEGTWEVRKVGDHWKLWESNIKDLGE